MSSPPSSTGVEGLGAPFGFAAEIMSSSSKKRAAGKPPRAAQHLLFLVCGFLSGWPMSM